MTSGQVTSLTYSPNLLHDEFPGVLPLSGFQDPPCKAQLSCPNDSRSQGQKILRKGQIAKSSLPAQNLQACKAEREKAEAGAHNNLLSMCIIFSVGKLK